MQTTTVKRWTRYGKDRLYVSTEDGQRVGWLDLLAGESTLEMPQFPDALHEALRGHQAGLDGVDQGPAPEVPEKVVEAPTTHALVGSMTLAPPPACLPPLEVVPELTTAALTDLALNRTGQGVRAEAEALLAGMKEQSRVGTFLKRALDFKTDERAFRVGAAGEEAVGPRLERLVKRGWRVLHSVPVGAGQSDIDHLLIGPGGVFTINTKNHPGGKVWVGQPAIRVNGQPTHYLRNSRFESERVHKPSSGTLARTSLFDPSWCS